MSDFKKQFGKRVAQLRNSLGLTQNELAEAEKPKRNETADEFSKGTKDERGKIVELFPPVDDKIIDTLVNTPALS